MIRLVRLWPENFADSIRPGKGRRGGTLGFLLFFPQGMNERGRTSGKRSATGWAGDATNAAPELDAAEAREFRLVPFEALTLQLTPQAAP